MRRRPKRAPIDVLLLLARLGIKATREAPTKLVAFCPNPEHDNRKTPAWFIRDKPGDPYHACHGCKSCGVSGGAASLVRLVLGLSQEESHAYLNELRAPAPIPVRLKTEMVERERAGVLALPSGYQDVELYDEAYVYLRGRNVSPAQMHRHGVAWIPDDHPDKRLRGRVIIPFWDAEHDLVSYSARAISPKVRKRYLQPSKAEGARLDAVFGEHLWGEDKRAVVLCEGAFDALAAERAFGPPGSLKVAALSGSEPHASQLLKLSRFGRVVVATDSDDAGEKAWQLVRASLEGVCELRRAAPPAGKDLDSMSVEDVRSLLEPHLRGMVGQER